MPNPTTPPLVLLASLVHSPLRARPEEEEVEEEEEEATLSPSRVVILAPLSPPPTAPTPVL